MRSRHPTTSAGDAPSFVIAPIRDASYCNRLIPYLTTENAHVGYGREHTEKVANDNKQWRKPFHHMDRMYIPGYLIVFAIEQSGILFFPRMAERFTLTRFCPKPLDD